MGDSIKRSWFKRGLALLLAVATILATTGINPGVFAAGEVKSVVPGATMQQVFASTAPNNGKMVVRGVEFNVEESAMTETSFAVHYNIYFNTEPREEVNLYTADTATAVASDSGDATAESAEIDSPIQLGGLVRLFLVVPGSLRDLSSLN